MNEKDLKRIFQQQYQLEIWKPVFDQLFRRVEWLATPQYLFENVESVKKGFQFARVALDDGKYLALFEVEVNDNINIVSNRVGLRGVAAKYIDLHVTHGALVLYHSPKQKDYRFSFIAKQSEFDTDGNFTTKETQPKRFTYLLGENETCTTAAKRFDVLIRKNKSLVIKDFIDAFSVEKLSKEFFTDYRNKHYSGFITYLTGENADGKRIDEPHSYLQSVFKDDKKAARDFVKKLLGRLVFMHFLQKKGWLGCPKDRTDWKDGDPAFLQNFFKNSSDKDRFLTQYLNELFFNTLNNDRQKSNHLFSLTDSRVPYLNGGLFDEDKLNTKVIDFPSIYFERLLDFFEQYNFTIDENDPEEQEVGIDPEMLGHIFENLLEDNKDKGAFYTPKEIVQYMCQESLIQYLKTHFEGQNTEGGVFSTDIEEFVRHRKVSTILEDKDTAHKINNLLKAVKICDPAIGSGAFPIGLLQEIFNLSYKLFKVINPDSDDEDFPRAKVKKEIIQNSIYGVDKDGGAVDIARLRFWLALIVDEDIPEPLPNLDYKIMQGDSLLEYFEGIPLNNIARRSNNLQLTVVEPQKDLFGNFIKPQTEISFINTEGGDFYDLLDQYFDASGSEKIKLHDRIDQVVLEHIHYNLREHEVFLQDTILKLRNGLEAKMKAFSNPKQREKLENESPDALKIIQLESHLSEIDNKYKKLKDLHDDPERPFFLWHLYFNDVFEDGGFDIFIGNPPYIQLQKMGIYAEAIQKLDTYKTFERTGDIYCLFYENGIKHLKNKGILCYITSSQWVKAAYGKSLRNFFLEFNPLTLLELGPNVFDSATVDTNILLIQKAKNKQALKGVVVNRLRDITNNLSDKLLPMPYVNKENWVIMNLPKQRIKETIELKGKQLKKWAIEIYFGVKTGYNDAFLIKEDDRNRLLEEDDKNIDLIRPILRGREIQKYYTTWEGDYVIATFPALNLDIEEYPSIKRYLEGYLPKLNQTGEEFYNAEGILEKTRKKTGNKWFETQDQIAFYNDFSKEKIIWKRIGSQIRFSYSDKEIYSLDSTCIATGEKIKYLTALLNSKVCHYQLFENAPKTGMGDLIISVQALEPLYVFYPDEKQELIFSQLVDYILFIKKQQLDYPTSEYQLMCDYFEQLIDGLVFELYFFESIQEAKRELFKYLPELPQLEEGKEADIVRKVFDTLHAQEHPIRHNLYYLTSVEEVRIITKSLKSKTKSDTN